MEVEGRGGDSGACCCRRCCRWEEGRDGESRWLVLVFLPSGVASAAAEASRSKSMAVPVGGGGFR